MANVSISTREFALQIQVRSNHVGTLENVHIVYEREKHPITLDVGPWVSQTGADTLVCKGSLAECSHIYVLCPPSPDETTVMVLLAEDNMV